MPVIFPALSTEEQTFRYKKLKLGTPFPFVYKRTATVNAPTFTGVSSFYTGGGMMVNAFPATNAMGIVALQFSAFVVSAAATYKFGALVSYKNSDAGGPTAGANGLPDDQGNEIYWNLWTGGTVVHTFEYYFDHPYYLAANQNLYFILIADAAAVAAGTASIYSTLVIHALQTGRIN